MSKLLQGSISFNKFAVQHKQAFKNLNAREAVWQRQQGNPEIAKQFEDQNNDH